MRLIPPILICLALAGCAGPTVTGARIVREIVRPDKTVERWEITGRTIRADEVRGLALPEIAIEVDAAGNVTCARIGAGSLATWKPPVDVSLLYWIGAGFLVGAVGALYFRAWGTGIILLAIGGGVIGVALNPWLGAIAAVGGVAYLVWPIWTERKAKRRA